MSGRFFGGVHPFYNKELAGSSPIEVMPMPEELVVHFSQNLGAPPKPVVEKGESVKRGQVIADAAGFVSARVHAPTSGTVKSIGDYPNPVGTDMPAALIIPDGNDEWADTCDNETSTGDLSAKDIRERVMQGGLVGMGGATFPTHVKLSPPKDKKIDLLIVNGAECEPYLTSDHRLMVERSGGIIEGAVIFTKAIGAGSVVVAIEKNKPDAVERMQRAVEGRDGLRVEVLDVIYPQGAEKQLIFAITGRRVPAGGLPMDVGVLVQNVGTCYAAYEALALGRPLTERVVTVSGAGIVKPKNVLARIGTKFSDLVSYCGGMTDDAGKVISGGPMMGVAQYSLEASVTKGTSGIVVLRSGEVAQYTGDACIRCGRCVDACPMRLLPSALSIYIERMNFEMASEYNVMDCIECGCCAYVCPSKRPMVHHFRRGKAEVRKISEKAG